MAPAAAARSSPLLLLSLLISLLLSTQAFMPTLRPALTPTRTNTRTLTARSPSLSTPMRGKSVAMMAQEYWEGEWVCADCGYIYNEDDCGGVRFEDQKAGFKCPQCSAPRRRFAKKVGDKIGVTNDGGSAPIVIFSIVGGLAVIGFGLYAAFGGL